MPLPDPFDEEDPFAGGETPSTTEPDPAPTEPAPTVAAPVPTTSDVSAPAEEPGAERVYGSVDEWLRKYWRFSYRRRVSAKGPATGRWKAEWWNSDEAVQRLETLWLSWEDARREPGLPLSAWWLNHAGPHMAVLLSHDGPFAGSTDENEPGEALPYSRPPDHLFPPDRQPD
ncbi:hypothetical protein C5D04_10130 [Rathayibacter sp. AY1D2]|jgi:hypothetical protein|uniref:DUF4913 domain-containing protein n=1 Tax=unclassified Rathayibacter TaxID=2609250 RepID=UPI000CE80714|nr:MULTISPECIES: DUF4913 domain-containing protein [unclassified Rathayibacter]PPG79286.1 hypothetical protein C5C52_12675 [Rathayibacter sp. AY1E5]PPH18444.1 hypothetical protein C5C99_13630 [Rathayibacter sp. AY1C4]PPH27145.1 hypothetical protein C5C37_14465 [Rathayibacter sp. AY1F9]PPH43725.1 hypothetical protein C5D09_14520 [Rathayibacter sp. AY1C9]PPH65127.1 hypothetical protein C5D25_04730 [Rathayibacter sp. AY1D7]